MLLTVVVQTSLALVLPQLLTMDKGNTDFMRRFPKYVCYSLCFAMCVCVCVCVCVQLYLYECVCVRACVYVCHCMCVYPCVSVYECACLCVCVSVCTVCVQTGHEKLLSGEPTAKI